MAVAEAAPPQVSAGISFLQHVEPGVRAPSPLSQHSLSCGPTGASPTRIWRPPSTPALKSPAAEEVVRQSGLYVSPDTRALWTPAPSASERTPLSARMARSVFLEWPEKDDGTEPGHPPLPQFQESLPFLGSSTAARLCFGSVNFPEDASVSSCALRDHIKGGGRFSDRAQPSRHGHTESSSERR